MNWLKKIILKKAVENMLKKLDGKKTYITMAVGIAIAALAEYNKACAPEMFGCGIEIPEWVYAVLFSTGILTRKAAKP